MFVTATEVGRSRLTVYDVIEVKAARAKCDELQGLIAELVTQERADTEPRHAGHFTIKNEAVALLHGEPVAKPAPASDYTHRRAVVSAALEMAERTLGAAILEASRKECEQRRPEHGELLVDIYHAIEALKVSVGKEATYRNEMIQAGFRDLLPTAFGSEQTRFRQLLLGLDLENYRARLVRLGANL